MFIKFIGITQELSALIEARRKNPDQAEHEILLEALRPVGGPSIPTLTKAVSSVTAAPKQYDLGQGVTAHVGEKLYLFLDEQAKKSRKPHGVAEIRADGLYVEGKKVSASRRSYITPAMRIFQDKLGHTNADGAMVSLNAYLKWHVLRDDKLVSLKDLKNPALARKRGQGLTPEQLENITLADLGL